MIVLRSNRCGKNKHTTGNGTWRFLSSALLYSDSALPSSDSALPYVSADPDGESERRVAKMAVQCETSCIMKPLPSVSAQTAGHHLIKVSSRKLDFYIR